MRIGVDATCWQNTRGYGRHARALFSTLVRLDGGNEYTFFMDSAEDAETVPTQADVRLVKSGAPTAVAAAADGHRSLPDMWRMSQSMSSAGLDVLIFPTVYSYVPVFGRAKKIVMIHDVIAETYPRLTLPSWQARLFWKAKVGLGRWQADAIVTVSDYSRQEIMRRFKTSEERIYVVGEASDPIFHRLTDPSPTPLLESLGLSGTEPYVVYVGGFGPHKNLEPLVNSFARLVTASSSLQSEKVRLVLVGEYQKEIFHSYVGTIRRQIQDLGLADSVTFTGYLPDEDLATLLNLARVLVLPSLMEGFGLPAVEAAACGCPVIATRASPLPSLLGEGGIYIDPLDPAELEQALESVLTSESMRRDMGKAGMVTASKLTWDAAARQLLNVISTTADS